MSSYSHARTASDIQTSVLLGLPEQSLNPPPSPSLDSHGFSLIQGDAPEQPPREVWERKLGSNEVSYYLPSRAEGVNDMYVVPLQTCRERRTEGRDRWALRPRVQGSPGRVRARKEGRDGHPSNARPCFPSPSLCRALGLEQSSRPSAAVCRVRVSNVLTDRLCFLPLDAPM